MTLVPIRTRRRLTDHQLFHVRHPDFLSRIERERTRLQTALNTLERDQDRSRQRDRIRKLLGNRRVHLVFAFDATRRTSGLAHATPEGIAALAGQFNAFRPVEHEPYLTCEVSKGSGTRRVQNFGPRRRMHQMAVHRILRSIHPLSEQQKLFRGGMPAARRAIEAAVAEGNRFGAEVDFVDFYGSLRPEALPDLLRPLPTSVVDAVVWDDVARRQPSLSRDRGVQPTLNSYEGLSLGSASSPAVGAIVIAFLLTAARLRDVVTFADNLFVLGRTEGDVDAKIQALRDVAGDRRFGELRLRVDDVGRYDLRRGFEFTKQSGVLRDDTIHWSPGHRKMEQYQIGVAAWVSLDQIDAFERRVVHWERAYPDWIEGAAHAAAFRAGLAVRRFYLDRNPINLRRAMDAVLVAYEEQRTVEPDFEGGLLAFIPREGDPHDGGYNRLVQALSRHLDRLDHAA